MRTQASLPSTALCRDLFFAFLEDQGVEYIFGNPGTTELPLVDGCRDHPSVRYVLSLHEDVAVAEAMGYARASGRPGVVNLHIAPGLAHGLGNLYNAFRARIPLLVTAGQEYSDLTVYEPILAADLAGLVRPFTKWAYAVRSAEELPVALQRAFKELATPPYSPVFLSLPMDLMLEKLGDHPPVRVSQTAGMQADQAGIDRAAELLAGATAPLIVAGDGVGHAGAWAELTSVAEALGAPVRTESHSTLWNFPTTHPLYLGTMPNTTAGIRKIFDDVDVLLMCGWTVQTPVARHDGAGPLVPWRVRTVALDDSPWEVGKNQPADVGLIGDIKHGLHAIGAGLHRSPPPPEVVARRRAATERASADRASQWEKKVSTARLAERISPVLIAAELRDRFPGAVFVDETISNRESFVNVLRVSDPLGYFAANGLSLGYSPGAAVGISLAQPGRPVVNVVGDGSLLYYPQALWNAVNSQAPVVFIVLNNGQYRVLKVIIDRMGGPWNGTGVMPPGLDLEEPVVDFITLARAMGVQAERVTTQSELQAALKRAADTTRPYLIDAVIEQGYSG